MGLSPAEAVLQTCVSAMQAQHKAKLLFGDQHLLRASGSGGHSAADGPATHDAEVRWLHSV